MNAFTRTPIAVALLLALMSTACTEAANEGRQTAGEATQAVADATAEVAAEGGAMSQAFAEAREKMQTENLPLSGGENLPKAELTPQGDLLIEGVAVPMTAEQRAAALGFRSEILAVGEAGMMMGEKGVDIAGDALAMAAKGIFGGDTRANEAAIEAKGKAMEAEATALCKRVAALDAAQKRLAVLLPAFEPYSKAMDIKADCNVAETTDDAEQQAEEAAAEATVST